MYAMLRTDIKSNHDVKSTTCFHRLAVHIGVIKNLSSGENCTDYLLKLRKSGILLKIEFYQHKLKFEKFVLCKLKQNKKYATNMFSPLFCLVIWEK